MKDKTSKKLINISSTILVIRTFKSFIPCREELKITSLRFFGLSVAMITMFFSLLSLFIYGLNLGLDFTGGYLTEYSTKSFVSQQDMQRKLSDYLPEGFTVSSAKSGTEWSVRLAEDLGEGSSSHWLTDFVHTSGWAITPADTMYIGSQVGEELINQGGLALLTALIIVLSYLSFRFEWRLAIGSIAALFHDVLLVLGCFAWFGLSFDLTVLASLLAIIGYSLNDSIIVGDKVRELLKIENTRTINDVIDDAVKAIFIRTLVTSGTTLATICAVLFFAGSSLQGFAVSLFIGVVVGTFSSISIAITIPQFLGLQRAHYWQKDQDICQLP